MQLLFICRYKKIEGDGYIGASWKYLLKQLKLHSIMAEEGFAMVKNGSHHKLSKVNMVKPITLIMG